MLNVNGTQEPVCTLIAGDDYLQINGIKQLIANPYVKSVRQLKMTISAWAYSLLMIGVLADTKYTK